MCSVVECMSMGILCLDHELCVIRYQLEGNQLHRLEMLSRASYQKKNQKRKKNTRIQIRSCGIKVLHVFPTIDSICGKSAFLSNRAEVLSSDNLQ